MGSAMPSPTRRRFFHKHPRLALLGVNALSLALLLALSEGALRLWGPAWLHARMRLVATGKGMAPGWSDAEAEAWIRNGKVIGYRPGSSMAIFHAEYSTRATADDLGGRRVSGAPQGRPLLPFLGDSFTFGVGVEDDETFVSLLQPRFDRRLVNLGLIGGSLPAYRTIVEERHTEFGRPPVYVVCVFLGNDLNDLLRAHRRAQAARDAARPRAHTLQRLNRWLYESPLRHLYLTHYAKQWLIPVLDTTRDEPVREAIFAAMDPNAEAYRATLRRELERELDRWTRLSERAGFRPIFVLIPDCHQVLETRRKEKARYYRLDPKTLDLRAPNRIVAQALTRRGFPYLDLTQPLADLPVDDAFYYHIDTHLTRSGHAAVATLLGAALSEAVAATPVPDRRAESGEAERAPGGVRARGGAP